jgi:hypothetical protein
MPTALIGLYSPAAQSGKSTIAKFLAENRGYAVVPFAQTLKSMTATFLRSMGYGSEEIEFMLTVNKEIVVPPLGVSVRHLLRTLGTEWGRQCVHTDVWLKCWQRQVQQYSYVVVDDVRFVNEADLLRSMGGEVWRVSRVAAPLSGGHASEGGLDAYADFAQELSNDGTVEDLLHKLIGLVPPY